MNELASSAVFDGRRWMAHSDETTDELQAPSGPARALYDEWSQHSEVCALFMLRPGSVPAIVLQRGLDSLDASEKDAFARAAESLYVSAHGQRTPSFVSLRLSDGFWFCLGQPGAASVLRVSQASVAARILGWAVGVSDQFVSASPAVNEPAVAAAKPAIRTPPVEVEPNTFQSELERELMNAFLFEAEERLTRCEALLANFDANDSVEIIDELFREFHTLKGAAASVGLDELTSHLHEAESALDTHRSSPGSRASLRGNLERVLKFAATEMRQYLPSPAPETAATQRVEISQEALPTDQPDAGTAAHEEVPDTNYVISHNSVSKVIESVEELRRIYLAIRAQTGQLRTTLGDAARSGGQRPSPLPTELEAQIEQLGEVSVALRRRMNHLVQASLDQLFERLTRPVRDAARQTGKLIDLVIAGGEFHAHRADVEALFGPMLHLVRNAVAHGIEAPHVRKSIGKNPKGHIQVSAVKKDGQVVITVTDDGAGINFDAVRARAEATGLIQPSARVSREELLRLIFHPGFTTQNEVNLLSGRGVGMDAVLKAVERMGGKLWVRTEPGKGTEMSIVLNRAPDGENSTPPDPNASRSPNGNDHAWTLASS